VRSRTKLSVRLLIGEHPESEQITAADQLWRVAPGLLFLFFPMEQFAMAKECTRTGRLIVRIELIQKGQVGKWQYHDL
jgi:hypothetical protein